MAITLKSPGQVSRLISNNADKNIKKNGFNFSRTPGEKVMTRWWLSKMVLILRGRLWLVSATGRFCRNKTSWPRASSHLTLRWIFRNIVRRTAVVYRTQCKIFFKKESLTQKYQICVGGQPVVCRIKGSRSSFNLRLFSLPTITMAASGAPIGAKSLLYKMSLRRGRCRKSYWYFIRCCILRCC